MSPNPVDPFTQDARSFPRVSVPGVDSAEVDALRGKMDDYVRTRLRFLVAMRFKGSDLAVRATGAEKARRRAVGRRAKAARKVSRGS